MKGKFSAVVFKVLAVVSALAIGGGYVVWRQVEAKKAMAEQAEAKEKGEREKLLREVDEAWQESVKELELMPGSKNPVRGPITRGEIDEILEKSGDFIQPIPGIPKGSEEVFNIETRLLPGSKSMPMPIFTKEQLDSRTGSDSITEIEKKEPAPENLLPSSKIGILRLPKKESEPSEEEETDLPE
jgi:hypothetical protein